MTLFAYKLSQLSRNRYSKFGQALLPKKSTSHNPCCQLRSRYISLEEFPKLLNSFTDEYWIVTFRIEKYVKDVACFMIVAIGS